MRRPICSLFVSAKQYGNKEERQVVTLVLPAQANATLVLITSDDITVVQVQLRKVGLDEVISQATFEKRSMKLRPAHFALLFRVTVVEIAQQLVVRQSPIVAALTKSNINQRGVALCTERAVNTYQKISFGMIFSAS